MKKIIFFKLLIIIIFQVNHVASVEPNEILKNSQLEDRARSISKNIRCMICQNQSIDESNADLAKDLRILIRNKIKEGYSDKQIYNYLTERYGDFILLKPPFKVSTILLWMGPFILLFIGFFYLYKLNKKFKDF